MNAKEAIHTAKSWIVEVFDEERPMNIGLEEVRFDDEEGDWLITVGFSRPWNAQGGLVVRIGGGEELKRTYKIVRVRDSDGEVRSVTNRSVS